MYESVMSCLLAAEFIAVFCVTMWFVSELDKKGEKNGLEEKINK